MSAEDTEKKVANKLMEILEEELSELNIKEVKKEDSNEFMSEDLPKECEKGEIIEEPEAFRRSSDNTADVLQKSTDNNQNEVECEINEKALDPPTLNKASTEIERQNNQYEDRSYGHKAKFPNQSKGVAVEKYLRQNHKNGCEKFYWNNEDTFVPPSDNLAEKILRRAELYFQDYNIFRNSFLLNHIRRNRKGFVSLKLVSSLRKIKALTKDSRVVAFSLMKSNILEMNPEKNKIRRIEPIPKIEDTSFGKTVMVFNLPQQSLSKEYLKELFSKFGTVVFAGVFEINSPESDIYHERCLYFHRKIASKIYGIVEFENYNEIVNALKDEDGHLPKENEIKVVPLMPQIYRKERRYLKFLDQYNPYPDSGRFKSRDESRSSRNDAPFGSGASGESGEVMRNSKIMGGYQFKRGYFRRPYKGRKPFIPPNFKNYSNGPDGNDYHASRSNKWKESRQLKSNNSFNIDRMYPNIPRKKQANFYTESGVQA